MQNFFWLVEAYSFAETRSLRNRKWLHISIKEGSETGKALEATGASEAGAQHCSAMQCIRARATCCSMYFKPLPHLLLWGGTRGPGAAFATQHSGDSIIQRK